MPRLKPGDLTTSIISLVEVNNFDKDESLKSATSRNHRIKTGLQCADLNLEIILKTDEQLTVFRCTY